MKNKTFYYNGRTWKVSAWDDTDSLWICTSGSETRYFAKEDINLCLMLNASKMGL